MAVFGNVVAPAEESPPLPKELLEAVFNLISSHERRVTVPLVCKTWREAVRPSEATASLWENVEIRDLQGRDFTPRGSNLAGNQMSTLTCAMQAKAISHWLVQRRDFLKEMTVFLPSATSVASWNHAFGQALPALASSSKLTQLTLRGPGVQAAAGAGIRTRPAPDASDADAIASVLYGAFSLPSLQELHVYDFSHAASLRFATAATSPAPAAQAALHTIINGAGLPPVLQQLPGHINLFNLRELVINRSFYQGSDGVHEHVLLERGAVEAWAALGAALQALPVLERLDLAHTHAITYCDPARGVAPAPWPPLQRLRELSLAHDLSVQPPPLPLQILPAAWPPLLPLGEGSGGAAEVCASGEDALAAAAAASVAAGAAGNVLTATSNPHLPTSAAAAGVAARVQERSGGNNDDGDDCVAATAVFDDGMGGVAAGAVVPGDAAAEDVAAGGALFGLPMLTVDATHALVELHSWLPTCSSLTSLDLRCCGLEAVPLAVAHLPLLTRLDLYGNPLVTMRLPGPLRSLAWLRLSLDPCYDLLADVMLAEAGEAEAVEEMWAVELPAAELEELEVDSTSARALGLIWAAAAVLPRMRRLVLTDRSSEALR